MVERYITRVSPKTRLTAGEAAGLLERAVISAKAVEAKTVLVRPATFVAVLHAEPALIQWHKQAGGQHRPHFRAYGGALWPLEISEDLLPVRRLKRLGAISRSLIDNQ